LWEALREVRLRLAREVAQPAFCVFHDSTLREIAQRRPQEAEGLLAISGVGPAKLEKYGAAFLEVLRRFGEGAATGDTGETPVAPGGEGAVRARALHGNATRAPLPPNRVAVWEALREARLALAREVGEKAFSLYPDSILRALAEARPLTLEALAAVREWRRRSWSRTRRGCWRR
jgi:superfamily II DNA helicase RecQ